MKREIKRIRRIICLAFIIPCVFSVTLNTFLFRDLRSVLQFNMVVKSSFCLNDSSDPPLQMGVIQNLLSHSFSLSLSFFTSPSHP